jgi:hypothetical protein
MAKRGHSALSKSIVSHTPILLSDNRRSELLSLQQQLDQVGQDAIDWELNLCGAYSWIERLIIIEMHVYLENKEMGCERLNNETHFSHISSEDPEGKLLAEAKRGQVFGFEKRRLRELIKSIKRRIRSDCNH